MTSFSSFRSRRFAQQTSRIIHHLVAFPLQQDWFALSVSVVLKVIPLGEIYGRSRGSELGLTWYQDREIIVIDLACFLGLQQDISNISQPYLLMIELENQLAGFPLDAPPLIYHVPDANLVSLPDSYLSKNNLTCLSPKMVKNPNHPPIFILDVQKLTLNLQP